MKHYILILLIAFGNFLFAQDSTSTWAIGVGGDLSINTNSSNVFRGNIDLNRTIEIVGFGRLTAGIIGGFDLLDKRLKGSGSFYLLYPIRAKKLDVGFGGIITQTFNTPDYTETIIKGFNTRIQRSFDSRVSIALDNRFLWGRQNHDKELLPDLRTKKLQSTINIFFRF